MAFYLRGWERCWGEERLSAAGLPASLAWMGEAGGEGGGRAEVGPQMPERAGGVGEALILRCCEVGRAQRDWPGFVPASSLALFFSSLWKKKIPNKIRNVKC